MIKRLLLAIALQAVCIALASADPINRFSWIAETTRATPERITCYRGETVELNADLFTAGHPANLHGSTATFFWQTNGMANAWWTAPASIESNRITVAFTPAMQPSASSVMFFLGASSADGTSYRANGLIRIIHSPGATPNVLPLPPHDVLDFATVTVLNPPWATPSDVSEAVAGLNIEERDPHSVHLSGLSVVEPDFLLSFSTMFPSTIGGDFIEYQGVPDRIRLSAAGLLLAPNSQMQGGGMAKTLITRNSIHRTGTLPMGGGSYDQLINLPGGPAADPSLSTTLATVDDVARAAEHHWDEPAGILWRTVYSNGYITVIAVTNVPAINQ